MMFSGSLKKWALILAMFFVANQAFAEKLVFFVDPKTNKKGVKNQSGKIIVPAQYASWIGKGENDGDVVDTPFIEFLISQRHQCDEPDTPVYAGGDVFDRKGNYLHSPLYFDMGTDYWSEGTRRFVEGCKVGFVNEKQEKFIPAQYGFAEPFYYGYSQVLVGKGIRLYDTGGIHWTLGRADEQAQFHVINAKGETVSGSLKPQAETDIKIGDQYFPTPYYFANDFERKLANKLNDLAVLNHVKFANRSGGVPASYVLRFQITQRPSKRAPYYELTGFTHAHHKPEKEMLIRANLRGQFHIVEYDNKPKPLKTWLLQRLADGAERTNAQKRFDVQAQIRAVKKMRF